MTKTKFLHKIAWQWWQGMRFAVAYAAWTFLAISELVALTFTSLRRDQDHQRGRSEHDRYRRLH